MTDNQPTTDTDDDSEEESTRKFTARLKAYLLGIIARVRAEIGRFLEEVAPQFKSALSGVSVPRGAMKPLALAVVLLIAAVAVPAAPFASDAPAVDAEPKSGNTTVSPMDDAPSTTPETTPGEPTSTEDSDATEPTETTETSEPAEPTMSTGPPTEYRQVVSSKVSSSSTSAPEAPEQVQTSAGSQTMAVETATVEGEPAIVLEDDRTHDGRWVSMDTSWFEKNVGQVPAVAYIRHETNGSYSSPIQVRGTSAAFYVEGFSSNTVTFDGELQVTADSATDGDTVTYDAPNGGSNLSVEVTGVENTKSMSTSATVSGSETLSATVGGNAEPRDETVTLTGVETTTSDSIAKAGATDGDSIAYDIGGNQPPEDATVSITGDRSTTARGPLTESGSGSIGFTADGTSVENAEVTFTGSKSTTSRSITGGTGSTGSSRTDSLTITGNQPPEGPSSGEPRVSVTWQSEIWKSPDEETYYNIPSNWPSVDTGNVKVRDYSSSKSGDSVTIDLEVDGTVVQSKQTSYNSIGNAIVYFENVSFSGGQQLHASVGGIDYVSTHTNTNGDSGTVDVTAPSGASATVSVSEGGTGSAPIDLAQSDNSVTLSRSGDEVKSFDIQYTDVTQTENPSLSVDGETVSVNRKMSDGETVTRSLSSLSPGSHSASVSVSGPVDTSLSWTDVYETTDPSVTIDGSTVSHSGVLGDGQTVTETVSLSAGASGSASVSTQYKADVSASWTEVTATQDPSVTVGGKTVSHSGVLGSGQTVSESVNLATGSQSIDVSTGGEVDVETSWTEVTETKDPTVSLNGNQMSHTGTLSAGQTVTLDSDSAWIQEGTNTVDISLDSSSLAAGSPIPKADVSISHDIQESRTVDYSAEAFSERYSVSKTWSENTTNATLTIPWASENVIAVRDVTVEYRDQSGTEPSPRPTPEYTLQNGSVVIDLGDVGAGWTTTVTANGSKVQVDGADMTVLEATNQSEDLNSRVRFENPSGDVYVRVGETQQGGQLHYLADASWGNDESSRFSAREVNEIRIPNAPDNGEAEIRTLPLAFDVGTGAIGVDIPDGQLSETEPAYRISPGDRTGDDYDVTHLNTTNGQPYVLWDETDEIVLDQGMASDRLTLSTEDSSGTRVIQFREDDGTVGSSGGGGGLMNVGGGGPIVTSSSPFNGFSGLRGLLPGTNAFLFGLAGLFGLAVLSRRTGLFDEGTRSDAVADATTDVATRAGGLLERVFDNEIVLAALTLGGGVWLLTSGAFTASERLIISLGSVPIGMFLVLQQFDSFDFRIWAGSTAVVGVLGIQQLAPETFTTIAEEAGVIIVVGAVLLGWRALSAWRAEASTPDSVTRLEIQTQEDDD